MKRIRAALAAEDRAIDDPSTPRLYELLVRSGETDAAAHVALAKFWLAKGEPAKAARIADAVTLLSPTELHLLERLVDSPPHRLGERHVLRLRADPGRRAGF
ncbi:MAG: hypothetical protein WCC48_01420 [Anaeromyxobacteraceae bacterium]